MKGRFSACPVCTGPQHDDACIDALTRHVSRLRVVLNHAEKELDFIDAGKLTARNLGPLREAIRATLAATKGQDETDRHRLPRDE